MSLFGFDDDWDDIESYNPAPTTQQVTKPVQQPTPLPQPVGTPTQTQQYTNEPIQQPVQQTRPPVQQTMPPAANTTSNSAPFSFNDDWGTQDDGWGSRYTQNFQPQSEQKQTYETQETFEPEYTAKAPQPEQTYAEEKFVEEPAAPEKIEPEITTTRQVQAPVAKPQASSWKKQKNWAASHQNNRKPPIVNNSKKTSNNKNTSMQKSPPKSKAVAQPQVNQIQTTIQQEPVQPSTPLSTEDLLAMLQQQVSDLQGRVDELEAQSNCVCNITSDGNLSRESNEDTFVVWNGGDRDPIPPESDCFVLENEGRSLAVLQPGVYEIKSSVRGVEMSLLVNGEVFAIGYSQQDKCPFVSTTLYLDKRPSISVKVNRNDYVDQGDFVNNFLCVRKVGV